LAFGGGQILSDEDLDFREESGETLFWRIGTSEQNLVQRENIN